VQSPDSEFPTFGLSGLSDHDRDARRLVGMTIDGRYRLDELIGEGGFGWVYQARQTSPDRVVAVKVSKRPAADSRRMGREADHQGSLDHPAIVNIIEAGVIDTREGSRRYVAMELVRGGRRIDAYCCQKQLSPRQRAELLLQVCDAVAFAHARSIIHRDLKPANILVTEDGNPKVIDFGIAKALGEAAETESVDSGPLAERSLPATLTAGPVGTDGYMSPEQAGGHQIDARSDVFALGRVLDDLFGASARTATGTPGQVPRWLRTIRNVCTHQDPARRYRDAGELAAALRGKLLRTRLESKLVGWALTLIPVAAAFGLWLAWPETPNLPSDKPDAASSRATAARITQPAHQIDGVTALAADPDGKHWAWVQSARGIAVARFKAPAVATGRPPGFPGAIKAIEISRSGTALGATGTDGVIGIWNLPLGMTNAGPRLFFPTAATATGDGRLLTFSPNARMVFAVQGPDTVIAWQLTTGQRAGATTLAEESSRRPSISGICRTAAEDRVVIGCSDGRVWIWQAGSMKVTPLGTRHAAGPVLLAATNGGECFASVGADRKLILCDGVTARPIAPPVPISGEPHAIAFTKDGKRLVIAARLQDVSADSLLEFRLYPLPTLTRTAGFAPHPDQPVLISGLSLGAGDELAITGKTAANLQLAELWSEPVFHRPASNPTAVEDLARAP